MKFTFFPHVYYLLGIGCTTNCGFCGSLKIALLYLSKSLELILKLGEETNVLAYKAFASRSASGSQDMRRRNEMCASG